MRTNDETLTPALQSKAVGCWRGRKATTGEEVLPQFGEGEGSIKEGIDV